MRFSLVRQNQVLSQESAALINSIACHANRLPGTRPFWTSHRNQLEAMVRSLGSAHLFVTFSAADLHWPDLKRHFPQYDEWLKENTHERHRIASVNIRDNPHIAAQWFHLRFEAFKDIVMKKHFAVTDVWISLVANAWFC